VVALPYSAVGRHTAAMEPAFILLLTLGIAETHRRAPETAAWLTTFVVLSFAIGIQSQMMVDKGDTGAAFARLARDAQPNDALVLPQTNLWPVVAYYHHRADIPVYYVPQESSLTAWDVARTPNAVEMAEFLKSIMAKHTRVWLGPSGEFTADPEYLANQWLAGHAFAVEAHYYRNLSLTLYSTGTVSDRLQTGAAAFGAAIHLQAAQYDRDQIKPGESLMLNLKWRTDQRLPDSYLVQLKLADDTGAVVAEHQLLPCGGACLTTNWPENETIEDRHAFTVPAGTPPGYYQLRLELYNLSARAALPVLPEGRPPEPGQGQAGAVPAASTALDLLSIRVLPDPNATLPAVDHPLALRFGKDLRLAGYEGAPPTIRDGEAWPVDLLWRAEAPLTSDRDVVFRWLDSAGSVVSETVLPVGTPAYPANHWQGGDVIRRHYAVALPADEGARGERLYTAQIQVRDKSSGLLYRIGAAGPPVAYPAPQNPTAPEASGSDSVTLGVVRVHPIERNFIAPLVEHPLSARFGERAELAGYGLSRSLLAGLEVTLYWRAVGDSQSNDKVFVHVIGEDNQVLAQHDGEPVMGARPTRSWQAGEYVKDTHPVTVPESLEPGVYRIEIGLYDPASGVRLPVTVNGLPQPGGRVIVTAVPLP
ncbi:MAG: hypothetical protein HYR71_11550, partial [Chloroflexi bacterium]|nr:hypothetical protein [Chloroflexota bacterium]